MYKELKKIGEQIEKMRKRNLKIGEQIVENTKQLEGIRKKLKSSKPQASPSARSDNSSFIQNCYRSGCGGHTKDNKCIINDGCCSFRKRSPK